MPEVTVAVANLNGNALLQRNLPALMEQQGVEFEVIVVDGGSADGSVEMLRRDFPGVRVLDLDRNVGFAAANNRAIRASASSLFAMLNNDAAPDPDWLSELVSVARGRPEFGSFASRMVFAHEPETINSAGISLDLAGIAWDRMMGEPDAGGPREVFGPSGGAALYRRELLEDVGGFDERFFAYLEDVDLAWRARLAGWRCLYVPTARVLHEHSATAVEGSTFKNYHLGRNKIWTIFKNYPMPQLLLYSPLIAGYDLASLPYTLATKRDVSILSGRIAALAALPGLIGERRRIQSRRRASWNELASQMDGFQPPWKLFSRYARLRRIVSRKPARS